MNATAWLSRMFDRWYRRQIARQLLLGQVRLGGRRIGPGPSPNRIAPLHSADRSGQGSPRRT